MPERDRPAGLTSSQTIGPFFAVPLVYQHRALFWGVVAALVFRAGFIIGGSVLLDRFRFEALGRKVVGVGSVGTRALFAVFVDDGGFPLLLQFKQANASVFEPYLGPSEFATHGERVVAGQRLMQAASDLFLGWATYAPTGEDFYFRQLRDMKGSFDLAFMSPAGFVHYARLCGVTLARAHVRSGDGDAIDGYLGVSDVFDRALASFAAAYADQVERDHAALHEQADADPGELLRHRADGEDRLRIHGPSVRERERVPSHALMLPDGLQEPFRRRAILAQRQRAGPGGAPRGVEIWGDWHRREVKRNERRPEGELQCSARTASGFFPLKKCFERERCADRQRQTNEYENRNDTQDRIGEPNFNRLSESVSSIRQRRKMPIEQSKSITEHESSQWQ